MNRKPEDMTLDEGPMMSCPFFAAFIYIGVEPVLLRHDNSNRCALIIDAHSPCVMQIQSIEPDWAACPRNPYNNGTGPRRNTSI